MGNPRACACVLLALAIHSTHANPVGGTVVPGSGAASISAALGTLTIEQSTPRVIINWQDFSVRAGEVTRFIQPSAGAAALNRVIGANPSEIYGTLQGNGAVFLINQNGILVGPGAQINVGSFIGSTLDFGPDEQSANASFLSGAGLRLSGNSTAAVRNEGYISAIDDVFLIAHSVQNAGTIRAHTVGMAAGADIELRQAGAERLGVLAGNTKAQPGSTDGVVNSGNISAVTAELKAAGGNIYALAINNGGAIRATGIVKENGRILLRADRGTVVNSGTLDASSKTAGGKGGDVKVLGERVGLVGDSKIDVSGDAGGGTVLVGGDLQGKNADVPNAQRTVIGRNSAINADALSSGDGGKVIVWSDEATRYLGEITARGAGAKGNGGFVEVSGKSSLTFDGKVNVAGSGAGANGTVLLDPRTITVQAANPDINGNGTAGDDIAALGDLNDAAADFPAADSIITAGAVNSLLTGNNNLILAATERTTINAAISGSDNASLTLNAPTVDLNATITLAGSGILSGTPTTVNVGTGGRIQNGIDVAHPVGATVNVAAGTYAENISVAKGLTLRGAQFGVNATTRNTSAGESIISGQVRLEAPNITFDGFTVRDSAGGAGIVANNAAGDRIINNYITANVFGMSLASDGSSQVLVQNNFFENNTLPGSASGNGIYTDFTVSNVRINANKFTGNPEGSVTFLGSIANPQSNVEVSDNFIVNPANTRNNGPIGFGNISGVTIRGNTISEAGDAIWIGGGVDGATIENNLVQNNDGAGVKFARPSSSGIAATSRNILIRGNSFSANVDGAILVDAREGTRYTDAGNGNVINASGNWWGSADVPTVSVGDAPSGTINFRVNLGDPAPPETVDFSPWLNSGVNGVAPGSAGFLGDRTVLNVSPTSPKATAQGFIAEALTAPFDVTTRLQLFAGNYNDQAIISIPNTVAVTLKGDVTLTAGTSVSFGSTVDTDGTARTLDVVSPSLTLGGAVGNAAGGELGRLTASGSTALNGGIVRTKAGGLAAGNQNYSGTVTLGGAGAGATLSGVDVTFAGIVGANRDLAVDASGNTTFNGSVSGVDELSTDQPGNTRINIASVSANTSIVIRDQLNLDSGTTLAAPAITLAGVTGNNRDLTLNASGVTTLGGAVNGVDDLVTDLGGSTRVNATPINATTIAIRDQLDLGINATLGASTLTLAGITGNGNNLTLDSSGLTTLNGVVSGVGALTTDMPGNTVINQTVNAGSLAVNDAVTLNGGTVTTSGSQAFNGTVDIGANTTLNNTTVSFGSTVNGNGLNLALNSSGDVTLVGGNILNVGNFSTTGGGSTRLSDGTLSANTSINIGDQLVLLTGTSLNAPTLTLAGVTGNSFDLSLNASGNTILNGVVSGVRALVSDFGGDTIINRNVSAVTFNAGDDATLNGVIVSTTGDQIYDGAVDLGGVGITTLNAAGVTFNGDVNAVISGVQGLSLNADATFNTFVGNFLALESLSVSGSATLNAGNIGPATVRTSGDQTYSGSVILGNPTTLSGNDIALAGVIGGGNTLRVNASGVTTLNGSLNDVAELRTDAPGSTRVNTPMVAANTLIDIADQLDLGIGTTLAAPTINLAGVTGNNFDLTLNASGVTTLNGAVAGVNDLRTDAPGSTRINTASVNANTSIGISDQLDLGVNVTLGAPAITLAGVTGNSRDLTLNGSGATTLNGLVNGVANFTTDAGGSTRINVASLNAGTSIDIRDQLDLGISTTLGAPAITLAGVTGNGRDLALNASGITTLNGAVAGVNDLRTDAAGSTRVNTPSVAANNLIEIADQLDLGAGTTLAAPTINLAGVAGNNFDLTLNGAGATTLNGTVAGVDDLRTDAPGSTRINTASVNANTSINIADQLDLGGNVTLGAAAITLAGVAGNARDLTLNASGVTTLNGAVNGVDDLNTDALGSTRINTPSISANGLIGIADQLDLGIGATLAAQDVTLAGVTGNGQNLTLNASDVTTLNGVVNGVGALRTDAAGNTIVNRNIIAGSVRLDDPANLNGGVINTTGNQDYNGPVLLGANHDLVGSTITFADTLDGARALDITGNAVFGANVGGILPLDTLVISGSSSLNGGAIVTSGVQIYGGAVSLGADNDLSATTVFFDSTVNGARNLFVSGNAAFGGAVGNSTELASLEVSQTTELNGGSVNTSGQQTYGGAVGLGSGNSLNGSIISFNSTVDSSVGNQSLNIGGDVDFNGAVGNSGALQSLDVAGSTLLNGGLINTVGDQNYGADVTLAINNNLAGAGIFFGGAIDGSTRTLNINALGDVFLGGNATLGALTIPTAGNILQGASLTVGDLIFCASGDVVLVNADNRIANADLNSQNWQASGPEGFAVVDGTSAQFFTGSAKGSALATPFNITAQRLITSLVPQVQFQEIQAELAGVTSASKEESGILTRSTKIHFKSTEALTRSTDVIANQPGN